MNRVTVSSSPAKVTLHYGQPVKVTLRYDQKGERGIGISSVALDEQAHLIVTYDDGKTQDAGAALGDVASIKDGIESSYRKIQASEANVTKLEASTKTNADKAQQALQDTQSASASGVNTINALTTEKMTYMTNTFNSLLAQAKANIDQWERDAEGKIHKVRTYSLEQIKTAHDDAMVDIERSVNKAEAWAVSETTPDREPDFESPTGLTQSSRSWALYSKKKVQESYDILNNIHDNEKNVANMKNDVNELLRRAQASEANAKASETNAENSYNKTANIQSNFQVVLDTAKASETNAAASASMAKAQAEAATTQANNAKTSATNANNSETQASEYKTSASDSATAAASSASSASESATDARAAMNTANTAASSASTSATNASTSASNASKSEIAAKTAQAAAEKARDDANSVVAKLTDVMKYAGQVDNYSDLADVTKNKGDVWNIVNANPAHEIKAGDNVVWNGTDWDILSGVVDLSAYAEKVDYQKVITSATANGATITFSHKDGTNSTVTVNNVASATAATNDAKGQKIDTTYEKIADADNKYYTKSSATTALAAKVDKVSGKQLSTEDYTTAEKTKLAGVDVGANKYVLPVASSTVSGGIKVGANLQMVDGVLNAIQGTVDLSPFETKTNAANTYVSKSSLSTTLVDYAKKSDVAQAVHYRGNVASFNHLPAASNNKLGDMYNVTSAGGTDSDGVLIKSGDNVVWNGTGWDNYGGTFTIESATDAEIDALFNV